MSRHFKSEDIGTINRLKISLLRFWVNHTVKSVSKLNISVQKQCQCEFWILADVVASIMASYTKSGHVVDLSEFQQLLKDRYMRFLESEEIENA